MDKGDRKLHVSKAHKEEESFLNRRKELFRRLPKIDRLMGRELTKRTDGTVWVSCSAGSCQKGGRAAAGCHASADFGGRKSQLCSWIHRTIGDRRMAYR